MSGDRALRDLVMVIGLVFGLTIANAQEGFITRDNCTTLAAPTVNTRCLQRTTTGGFNGGTILRYNGAAWEQADPHRGGCSIVLGSDSSLTALTNTDLSQGNVCQVPQQATVLEVSVNANSGTPNVTVSRFRPNGGTSIPIVSAPLQTGAAGALACSRASAGTSINGVTSCVGTLQNTGLNAGDFIYLLNGIAGGTATRLTIAVTWIW